MIHEHIVNSSNVTATVRAIVIFAVELRPAAIGRRLACLPSLHGTNKQRVGSDRCGQESTDSGHRDEYATTAHNVYHSASSVRITVRAASALTSGTVTAQNAQSLSRWTWDAAHL